MELKGLAIYNDGVSGVVTAVKTDHIVRISSKEISYLSFAFIAPLGANDYSDIRRIGRHFVPYSGLAGWRLMSLKKEKYE